MTRNPSKPQSRRNDRHQMVYRCIDCGYEERITLRKAKFFDGRRCSRCGTGRYVSSIKETEGGGEIGEAEKPGNG